MRRPRGGRCRPCRRASGACALVPAIVVALTIGAPTIGASGARASDGVAAAGGPVRAPAGKAALRSPGPASRADTLVDFRLDDQFGRVHAAADLRGRALLLVAAGQGGRAVGTAWVQTLRGIQEDAAGTPPVPVVAVADLRGLPRLLRRVARRQFPKDRRQPVLIDWDGTLARRLALDPGRCTILLVGPAGELHARWTPGAVDTVFARALLRRAAALTPTSDASAPGDPAARSVR